jgi:hypothetical protein
LKELEREEKLENQIGAHVLKSDPLIQTTFTNTIPGMILCMHTYERISVIEVFLDMSEATWPLWGLERELLKVA